ncbi:leukocyte cell-derived chemotaxin-2-like, partial [Natator depressus]|uniref:leukocyte cell-derived chemotaxin-2-like n=1 Tax=Natator depressus TaxID=27790 RepID=UPI003EBE7244
NGCNVFPLKVIVFVALVSIVAAGPWGQICARNPSNRIRGCDRHGCGHYGAPEVHLGMDVICRDRSTVYAPFSGIIGGPVNPYRKNTTINNGLFLRGSGFCTYMFYIRLVTYRVWIKKGQKIGVMLPMQSVYPGMISHVQVQNREHSNPSLAAGQWAQICDGTPWNSIRGCDKYGCGYYGAPRNGKKHLAVIVKCQDGSGVYAPFSGLIVRCIKPFGNNNAIDDGILLSEVKTGSCIKLAFIRPLRSRGWIRKGSKTGVMLPMQCVYPDIISHVRIQNCDHSNPTGNL